MLKGKVSVITGGSRGIGREIALKLAEQGSDIAVIYSGNEQTANEVCELAQKNNVKAKCYKCNVSNFENAKDISAQIINDFGGVDVLINNAGITKDNLIMRMSESDFDDVIDVNLICAFNLIKHFCRALMKSKSGRIINVTSISGIMGNAGQANYAASKAGLIGLTKTVAKEFSSRNVTCNAIAPGFIQTDMTAGLPQEVTDYVNKAVPLKRMGNPEEVANLAVFLASDLSSYITGEVIKVDGGLCM
jgi:3-oxoacyl-[acyl-carrier protein] reductase